MVEATTVSVIIASASIVAGVMFYVFQIRSLVKSRQMDIVMRLYLTWGSEDMKRSLAKVVALKVQDYETFTKEHGSVASPSRSPIWTDIDRVGWFLNGLGFIVHRRLVSIGLIDELFGYLVVDQWKKLGPLVVGWRAELNYPKSFRWFEYLAKELEKKKVGAHSG